MSELCRNNSKRYVGYKNETASLKEACWWRHPATELLLISGESGHSYLRNHGKLQISLCFNTESAGLLHTAGDDLDLPAQKQHKAQVQVNNGTTAEDQHLECSGQSLDVKLIRNLWHTEGCGQEIPANVMDLEQVCTPDSGVRLTLLT